MGNGKAQDPSVHVFGTVGSAVHVDNTSLEDSHAVSVGSVRQVESLLATFDFTSKEWKVDVFTCSVVRLLRRFDVQLPPLLFGKIGLLESEGVVWLWTRPIKGD